jgi:hypothetical protein
MPIQTFIQEKNSFFDLFNNQKPTRKGGNLKVDIRMSIMKLNLCPWLFHAWIHVKNMNEMICKGWEINETIKELQHAIST